MADQEQRREAAILRIRDKFGSRGFRLVAESAAREAYDAATADNAERAKAFREDPNEYRFAAMARYIQEHGAATKMDAQSHAFKAAWDECNAIWGPMWEMADDDREKAESALAEARATIERVRAVLSEIAAGHERTSMALDEAEGRQDVSGVLRCSSRKAALEQMLESLRTALGPVKP